MSRHLTGPAALRRGAWFLGAALAAALWGLPGAVPARAADEDPRLLKGDGPDAAKAKPVKGELQIRPNVEQPVFLFVECPADAPEATEVKVEVWAGGKATRGRRRHPEVAARG